MQFVANIPYIKCYLKKEYLYDLEKGHGEFEECVLLSVKSMQGRALMFEAYLPQYGACYDKFPLSAFVWKNRYQRRRTITFKCNRVVGCVFLRHTSMDKTIA